MGFKFNKEGSEEKIIIDGKCRKLEWQKPPHPRSNKKRKEKVCKTWKEARKYYTYTGNKNKSTGTVSDEAQTLDFLDKDFKLAILNIFNELKETMSKELKENERMMSHQIENINKNRYNKKEPKQKFWSWKV